MLFYGSIGSQDFDPWPRPLHLAPRQTVDPSNLGMEPLPPHMFVVETAKRRRLRWKQKQRRLPPASHLGFGMPPPRSLQMNMAKALRWSMKIPPGRSSERPERHPIGGCRRSPCADRQWHVWSSRWYGGTWTRRASGAAGPHGPCRRLGDRSHGQSGQARAAGEDGQDGQGGPQGPCRQPGRARPGWDGWRRSRYWHTLYKWLGRCDREHLGMIWEGCWNCPSLLLHSSILARVLCVFFADSPAEHGVLQRSSEDLECLKLGSIGYNSGICPIFKF